jgi:glycosyltransferase involved in cell wall biosynthesis
VTPGIPEAYLAQKRGDACNREKGLLFVGRLDRKKGLDRLLDIFRMLKDRYPGLRLTIAGDGPERRRIENAIKENGLRDIRMVGQIPQSGIYSYYLNSTVMVHPSDVESFSMVVLEAMASGLPVVATDLAAIKEASEGEAILLPKDDLKIWVEKISHLLEDGAALEEMSARMRRVAAKHTWDKKSLEFENLLSRVS